MQGFIAVFASRDVERIMSFFADDAGYYNMPMKPARGAKEIRPIVEFVVNPAQEIEFRIFYTKGFAEGTKRNTAGVLGYPNLAWQGSWRSIGVRFEGPKIALTLAR